MTIPSSFLNPEGMAADVTSAEAAAPVGETGIGCLGTNACWLGEPIADVVG